MPGRTDPLITRWRQANVLAGYIVFGLPAAIAVPAAAATISRFGLWNTLTSAALPLLVVAASLLLWIRYTRHHPVRKLARLAWAAAAGATFLTFAVSPIWFWSGPLLAVLLSELALVLTSARARRRHTGPALAKGRL